MVEENSFRQTIDGGESVIGARSSTYNPATVEIYGDLGLDFVWLDFEHSGPSPADGRPIENLCRAAELAGTEILARVPPEPDVVRKVLDAGVRNVLVPRVDDADDVRRAVEASRFRYEGEPGQRGYAGWRSSEYGSADDYVDREDDQVCVGAMIEMASAVEDIDDILDVPELGFAFIGPSDLSVQLGHPGDTGHPRVREAIEEVEAKCRKRGVPLGGVAHGSDAARDAIDRGYQVVRLGGDLEAARETLRARLDSL